MIEVRSKLHEFCYLIAFKLRKNFSNFATSEGSNDAEEMLHSGLQIQLFLQKTWEEAALKNTSVSFSEVPRRIWKMKKVLPFIDIKTSTDTVICKLQWHRQLRESSARGKPRPKHSASVWQGVLSTRISRPMSPPGTTCRASLVVQNAQPDELQEFLIETL